MATKLRVYVNEDDALLFWSISKPIPQCRGFAIQRRIKRKGKKKTDEDFLVNRTGFENEKTPTKSNSNAQGELEQAESQASLWSPPRVLGTTKGHFKPFFNRGFVMSQFMARFLKEKNLTLPEFKDTIKDKDDQTIRQFLSGDLRLALLKELDTALKTGGQVFAALFELSDDELIEALGKLKGNANVVLANG